MKTVICNINFLILYLIFFFVFLTSLSASLVTEEEGTQCFVLMEENDKEWVVVKKNIRMNIRREEIKPNLKSDICETLSKGIEHVEL